MHAPPLTIEEPHGIPARMRGLLFRDTLPRGRVMLLRDCRLIHTIGMRFTLDVVFLDASGATVKTIRNLRPGRIAFGGFRARHTIEAAAGWLSDGVSFKSVILP